MKSRVAIPLAQSEQRGTDPILTDGSLITSRNAVITQQGRADKRTGLTAKTGTFDEEVSIVEHNDRAVLLGDRCKIGMSADAEDSYGSPFVYDEFDRAHHCHVTSTDDTLEYHPVSDENPWHTDVAELADGNYAVANSYNDSWAHVAVVDPATGTVLVEHSWLATATSPSAEDTAVINLVVSENGDAWYIYIDPTDHEIWGGTISSTAIGAASSLYSTELAKSPSGATYQFNRLDCCAVDGDNIAIAYITDNVSDCWVNTLQMDATDGTIGNNLIMPTHGDDNPVYVGVFKRSGANFNVIATDNDVATGDSSVYIIGYTMASGLATADNDWQVTLAETLGSGAINPHVTYNVTGVGIDDDNVTLFYTAGFEEGTIVELYKRRAIRTIDVEAGSGGMSSPGTGKWFAYGPSILSKPVLDANGYPTMLVSHYPRISSDPTGAGAYGTYVGVTTRTQLGSTFVVKMVNDTAYPSTISPCLVVGKLALDRTYWPTVAPGTGSAVNWTDWADPAGDGCDLKPNNLVSLGDNKWLSAVPLRGSVEHARITGWQQSGDGYDDAQTVASGGGTLIAVVDLSPPPVRAVHGGNLLSIPGSCPYLFDGKSIVESGNAVYVEDFHVTVDTGATAALQGDIAFAVLPHWVDAQGNSHYGTPAYTEVWSSADMVTAAGGNVTDFTFNIAPISLTRKPGLRFLCYRTKDGGKTYYYVGSVLNSPFAYQTTLITTTTDGNLVGPGLYTDLEVENSQPPPSTVGTFWQGREFFVDSENSDWLIRYSKPREENRAPGHNELYQIHCTNAGGAITGMEPIGDRLLIFKESQIYATAGRGLDNQLGGTNYSEPQLVLDGIGCINQRTIVRMPAGVMFLSSTGIYLVTPALGVSFIGQPVKRYTETQTIACALADTSRDIVVFLASGEGEYALVYNYAHDQWGTWSNYECTDATMVGDEMWLKSVDKEDSIVVEDRDSYADHAVPIATTVDTGWLSMGQLDGFKRLERLHLVGYNRASHTLTIKIAYDYDPVWVDTITASTEDLEEFGPDEHYGAMSTVPVESAHTIRFRGSRTKFNAIRVSISDAAAEQAEDSPLALWYFDESAEDDNVPDATGNGYTAVPSAYWDED